MVAQEGGHGEQAGHGESADHDNLTFWKFPTFAILACALGYAIAKNGGPFFRGRSEEIRKGILESRKMREQAEARAADMEARLQNLGAEIESLKKTARMEAEAETQRLREETQRELARVRELADQELQTAVKAAQMALRQHAAGLAITLARKKAESRMSDANQDSLVQAFAASTERNSAALKSAE
jgi:F0F1-type ATP synthase membrane subunit b/b'